MAPIQHHQDAISSSSLGYSIAKEVTPRQLFILTKFMHNDLSVSYRSQVYTKSVLTGECSLLWQFLSFSPLDQGYRVFI